MSPMMAGKCLDAACRKTQITPVRRQGRPVEKACPAQGSGGLHTEREYVCSGVTEGKDNGRQELGSSDGEHHSITRSKMD